MTTINEIFNYCTFIFQSYTNYITEISNGNEMMSGLLAASILAGMTMFLRSTPSKIYHAVKSNIITSFSIAVAGETTDYYGSRINTFLSSRMRNFSSRSLSFNPKTWHFRDRDEEHDYVSIGYGFHWFFYNGRLFWMRKNKLESSGSNTQKEEIIISTFGRSHEPFKNLAKEFVEHEDNDEHLDVFLYSHGEWSKTTKKIKTRSLDSIIMNSNKLTEMLTNIDNFKNNKEWFDKSGLPYKLTYVLHGIPGTGKTSIIKALASHYKMKLCILNINTLDDKSLPEAINRLPSNSILAIEDFDSNVATRDRGIKGNRVKDDVKETFPDIQLSGLTLTGLLNTLDGLIPLENTLIFLTTNSIETVDPALYRKGRVDYLMEIGEVYHDDILSFSSKMFNYEFDVTFKPTIGCNINEALMYSRGNPERYLEFLKENNMVEDYK